MSSRSIGALLRVLTAGAGSILAAAWDIIALIFGAISSAME